MAKRRSRAEWEQLVREVEQCKSIDEVARRHDVQQRTLAWWRWQLRRGTVARSATRRASVKMVPVRVRPAPRAAEPVDDVIEVALRGALVRVRVGQDTRYIAELAAALTERC